MAHDNGSSARGGPSVADRLMEAVRGVPEGGSVTLPVDAVRRWLENGAQGRETPGESPRNPVADLTVADIADAHDKAPSTVRGWLQSVPGVYRLGQELRIPRRAWREYLDSLAAGGDDSDDGPPEVRSSPEADLGSWRDKGHRN